MYPPNYQSDYFLYIVTTDITIAMVLVQVENRIERLIYYLSRNLNDTEVNYLYVEKLALAAVQVVQIFFPLYSVPKDHCHFILKTHDLYLITSISGGKYSKWIVIL